MRCANCSLENPRKASQCTGCGAALTRRNKRRGIAEESDTPFGGPVLPPNRAAIWAYRVSVAALVPGPGLILGPVALLWGAVARWRGGRDPGFTAHGPATGAMLLGLLTGLTNWIGLVLMIRGLTMTE